MTEGEDAFHQGLRPEADAGDASRFSLQRLQNFHEALNAHAGVVATDGQGCILEANARFCEMCGFSEDELVGQTFRLLHSGLHGPEYYRGLWQTLRGGRAWKGEFCNRAKDGRLYWVSATIVPYTDATGELARFVAVEEDISEFKAAKEALLQMQHLEQMGLMASGMAHDFNNLMQSLLGGLEGLKVPAGAATERMEALREVAVHCQALAARLMKVGRGGIGAPEWSDLNFVVRDLMPVLRQMLKGPCELDVSLSGHVPRVWLDPLQAQQVILNLVGNARDAMADGGRIQLRTVLQALRTEEAGALGLPEGEYVALEVEDQGPGMSESVMARITEPFFTTKGPQRGTGLGLAVTQMILHAHGGALACVSRVGIGTRMRALWPAAVGA